MHPIRRCALVLATLFLLAPAGAWTQQVLQPESAPQRQYRESRERTLKKTIGAMLAAPGPARAYWGVFAIDLETGNPIFQLNPDKYFTPASNTKLFSTVAALATVGPDFRFKTTVETSGVLDSAGKLQGDLILVGRGDPNLSGRVLPYRNKTQRNAPHLKRLEELADQVAAKGVREVTGDIVGDDTYFVFERYPEGWAADDLMWEHGAPVSALIVNDNVVFVQVRPGANVGDPAGIVIDPDHAYYEIDNRMITTAAGSGPRKLSIDRQPGSKRVVFWGTVPLDDTSDGEALAIEDPADYAAQAFRSMLEKRGITIAGRARPHHIEPAALPLIVAEAGTPGGGSSPVVNATSPRTVLASRESEPLIEDVRVINKISQNLHAEVALRLLAVANGKAANMEAALEAQKAVLARAGIAADEVAFYDGSGLSRQTLVTPRAVVKLLQFAAAQPWGAQFRDGLPISGTDGTLAKRLTSAKVAGKVFAKTGSFSHTNSLAGYATTATGKNIIFSIAANHHRLTGRGAMSIIDKMVEALVNDEPPVKKPVKRSKRTKNKS